MKPSDVVLWRSIMPLVDTLGHVEEEIAAAILVRACVANGDVWQPIDLRALGDSFSADIAVEGPWKQLARNPFTPSPSFSGLVKRGFAEWGGEPGMSPLSFTELGLVRLREKATQEGFDGIDEDRRERALNALVCTICGVAGCDCVATGRTAQDVAAEAQD